MGKIISSLSNFKNWFLARTKIQKAVFFMLIVVVLMMTVFLIDYNSPNQLITKKFFRFALNAKKVNAMVADNFSASANIVINIPEEFKGNPGLEISFFPKLKGSWVKQEKEVWEFDPQNPMKTGIYYRVFARVEEEKLSQDFLVHEDPKIVSTFPAENTEVDRHTDITLVFNRPMVPLTTLDNLDTDNLPITITPETKGRFKWISTRMLQFLPTDGELVQSSNYTVEIGDGIKTVDNVGLPAKSFSFTTTPLRFISFNDYLRSIDRPITIDFNQPVNLLEMTSNIFVSDRHDNDIKTVVEYGYKKEWNKKESKYEEVEDKSQLLVYQYKDKFGNSRRFDYDMRYKILITKSIPLFGDIHLNERLQKRYPSVEIIERIWATSERDPRPLQNHFDPLGTLVIEFREPISLSKTKFWSDAKYSVDYYEDTDDVLVFKFKDLEIGQNVDLKLKKLVSKKGYRINDWDIDIPVKVVENLSIKKVVPGEGYRNNNLTSLVICSNNPLATSSVENIDSRLITSNLMTFFEWHRSRWSERRPCYGGYTTQVIYGLEPQTEYSIDLEPEDVYGTHDKRTTKFKTKDMSVYDMRIVSMSSAYETTHSDHATLTYIIENVPELKLRACRFESSDMLENVQNYSNVSWGNISHKSDCKDYLEKIITGSKKYWQKRFVQIDLKELFPDQKYGHFLVELLPAELPQDHSKRILVSKNYISISDIVVTEKAIRYGKNKNVSYTGPINKGEELDRELSDYKNLYWVVDREKLDPIEGAKIEVFNNAKYQLRPINAQLVEEIQTDNQGIARGKVNENIVGVVVSLGEDSTILVRTNSQILNPSKTSSLAEKTYIYTDRPIYRPKEEVFIKGIHRIGYDGSYEILPDRKFDLTIKDSQNNEVYKKELSLSQAGTFSDVFVLPEDSKLGNYKICALSMCHVFSVEKFVNSPFEVKFNNAKDEFILGDKMNINLKAQYFFGVPLDQGEVTYSLTSQDYHFDKYSDEYFDFGNPWYFCYFGCDFKDKNHFRKTANLNANGEVEISESLGLSELFKDDEISKSKIMTLNATVTGPNGNAVSAQHSFLVHNGNYYIGVKTDKPYLQKNEQTKLRIKTVDTSGKPIAVSSLFLKINKIEWVQAKRQEVDGGYYNRYEKKYTLVKTERIKTNKEGDWSDILSLSENGQYEIDVTGYSKNGNKITNDSYRLYVWGSGEASVRKENDTSLELIASKRDLNVGDKAEAIIMSPTDEAKALITVERGHIFDYEVVEIKGNVWPYSFTVREDHIPNISLSAVLLTKDPSVKSGSLMYSVDRKEKEISVEITTDKEKYLPGEKVELQIKTTDHSGSPISAEVSIALVDLSVLALKGNPKKNPITFFYDGFPVAVTTSNNLKNLLQKIDIKPGKGGGGGLAEKKRGKFENTAFWKSAVKTDRNGIYRTTLTLPDNLTRWQFESVAVTDDTKVGVGYDEITARKSLMVVPLAPRFVIPGDEFTIGAQVFNQTESKQSVNVTLKSDSLVLTKKDNKQKIKLKPGESKTVYFPVLAPTAQEKGLHVYEISAISNNFSDVVEKNISITRNNTYETVAMSNYTKNDTAYEYLQIPEEVMPDRGNLTVRGNATLAVFLFDTLSEMIDYPYGCTEQIASRLSTLAVLKRAQDIPNVPEDLFSLDNIVDKKGNKHSIGEIVEDFLPDIYSRQKSNGGFVYYNSPWAEPSPYLTMHVVDTFIKLENAGFKINEDAMRKAIEYISNPNSFSNYYHRVDFNKNKDLGVNVAYILSKTKKGLSGEFKKIIDKYLRDESYVPEKSNNMSLALLADVVSRGRFSKKEKQFVMTALENRLEIDSRGAFLPSSENRSWYYYEHPIKNTALSISALRTAEKDNQLLGNMLRWILFSRDKSGDWGSTNNNIAVVEAFVEFLIWQEEYNSEFDLKIKLDNSEIGSHYFGDSSVWDQYQVSLPMNDLPKGAMSSVDFTRERKNELQTNFYYDMSLKYFLPAEDIPARDEGFFVERNFYNAKDIDGEKAITKIFQGEVIRGRLKIIVPKHRSFVAVEDFIPAGTEIINFSLSTSDKTLEDEVEIDRTLPNVFQESHDDRIFLFSENVPPGIYEYDYYLRALIPGTYQHLPAVVSEMYFPENFGRTNGSIFTVDQK